MPTKPRQHDKVVDARLADFFEAEYRKWLDERRQGWTDESMDVFSEEMAGAHGQTAKQIKSLLRR